MNDQLVKQLANQNERIANLYNIGPVQRAEVEQFVEAIAYECIDLALGSSHREDDMGAIIANKIKKHFGVEL